LKEYDELHLQPPQLIRSEVGVITTSCSSPLKLLELNSLQQQIKRIVIHPFSILFLLFLSSVVLQGGMIIIILLFETYKAYRDLNLPSSGGS
jgi:hypothetical protein